MSDPRLLSRRLRGGFARARASESQGVGAPSAGNRAGGEAGGAEAGVSGSRARSAAPHTPPSALAPTPFRGHVRVPAAGSPRPPAFVHFSFAPIRQAPSAGRPGLGAEGGERPTRGEPRTLGTPQAGPEVPCRRSAAELCAPRQWLFHSWPGSGNPRRGHQPPHRQPSDSCRPRPPRIREGAEGEGPPSGCPVSSGRPLPGVGTSPRRSEGGTPLWRGGRGAGRLLGGYLGPALALPLLPRPARALLRAQGGRTMLCCLLVKASNLPTVKKDRRSDPVASLTFRGESPAAAPPTLRARPCLRPWLLH